VVGTIRPTRNSQMRDGEGRAWSDGPGAPERICRMRSNGRPRYLGIARCCLGGSIASIAHGTPLVVYNTKANYAVSAIEIRREKFRLFAICGSCRRRGKCGDSRSSRRESHSSHFKCRPCTPSAHSRNNLRSLIWAIALRCSVLHFAEPCCQVRMEYQFSSQHSSL
jgi:hypothetical protein